MQILSGKLTDKQEFISEVTVLGRALTKAFYLCIARAHNRKKQRKHKLVVPAIRYLVFFMFFLLLAQ